MEPMVLLRVGPALRAGKIVPCILDRQPVLSTMAL